MRHPIIESCRGKPAILCLNFAEKILADGVVLTELVNSRIVGNPEWLSPAAN
jgi:hypothetical protein